MWIIAAWQCISPEVTVKGFRKCCMCCAVDGTDGDMLWNGSEGNGDTRVSVGEMKALTVKMETVTLSGKGG
jgi:hypothetical protein